LCEPRAFRATISEHGLDPTTSPVVACAQRMNTMTLSREAPAGLLDPETSSSATPVRAQLLATEHWSLLAARGMTWSEVMSRIAVHLTISSAALVVLALVTQATGFGVAFHVLSIGLTSVILALGTLTGVRVHNASREDAAIILGMNRLRAGYVKMDPGIAEYLVTSRYDDQAGLMATYTMGMRRSAQPRDGKHVNVHQHRQRDRGRHPRRADR
jgi:hypothetical protein